MKNLTLSWTGRFVAVALLTLALCPHSIRAITGGGLDGEPSLRRHLRTAKAAREGPMRFLGLSVGDWTELTNIK